MNHKEFTVESNVDIVRVSDEPGRFRWKYLFDHDYAGLTGHFFMSEQGNPTVTLEVDTGRLRKLR